MGESINQRAIDWIVSSDTGISSETIWATMMGAQRRNRYIEHAPSDPSDFGRCYRLLNLIPEWKGRLFELTVRGKDWACLIPHWEELTRLYEEELPTGSCPKLYGRMKVLLNNMAKGNYE